MCKLVFDFKMAFIKIVFPTNLIYIEYNFQVLSRKLFGWDLEWVPTIMSVANSDEVNKKLLSWKDKIESRKVLKVCIAVSTT